MRLTVLYMLSTSSLQAFSGATTTAPLNRPDPANPVRLARAQPQAAARQASPALPGTAPANPPPRGSLLNLSV